MTILELLQKMRSNPVLPRESVELLYVFLTGFAYARRPANDADYAFLEDWSLWVRERFRITSTQSWADVIRFFSIDGRDSYKMFWKLLDIYLNDKGTLPTRSIQ